jgi:TMEM70/TMEM186/TMEM223 protein family
LYAKKLTKNIFFKQTNTETVTPQVEQWNMGPSFPHNRSVRANQHMSYHTWKGRGTGLLHWFTSPYIHRLVYDPTKQDVTVTVLNLLARPVTYTIPLSEIGYPNTLRPQASFEVRSWPHPLFCKFVSFCDSPGFSLVTSVHTPSLGLHKCEDFLLHVLCA